MKGIISTEDLNSQSLVKKAKTSPGLIRRDLVKEVTCKGKYVWKEENKIIQFFRNIFLLFFLYRLYLPE